MENDQEFISITFDQVVKGLPLIIKEKILLDRNIQKKWHFETFTTVTFEKSGPTFKRHTLFDALRSAIDKLSTSVDLLDEHEYKWSIKADKDKQGNLEFRISSNQISYRLGDYSLLAHKKEILLAWLDKVSKEFLIPEKWIQERKNQLTQGPLNDESFIELCEDIEFMPAKLDNKIRRNLQKYRTNFYLIAPDQLNYYSHLVGELQSQTSVSKFIDEISGPHIVDLVQNHGTPGLRQALLTCGHPQITAKIPLETLCNSEILKVFEQLAWKGDPVSRVAAVELWLENADKFPELEKPVTHIIKALLEGDDNTSSHYDALSSVFAASMGVIARKRLFSDAPPFYRRHAALAHASLFIRAMIEEGSDISGTKDWLERSDMPYVAFCQVLIDLRTEPCWLPEYGSSSQLRAEIIGRLFIAVRNHSNTIKSSTLKELLIGPESVLEKIKHDVTCLLPGPLEGVPIKGNSLPENILEDARQLFSGPTISPVALLNVVNYACISGDTTEIADLACKALKRLDYLVETMHDETVTFEVLARLAMAGAISRNRELARSIQTLARVKRKHNCFRDYPENQLQIAFIAASAFDDIDEWASFLGDWIFEIADSFESQKTPDIPLTFIRQLRQLEPRLLPYFSKAEAVLTIK